MSANELKQEKSGTFVLSIGASGAAAIVYEVVWLRALTNTFGATSYSFSILLAAFLAGLAIGSRWAATYIRSNDHPLLVFSAVQLGIGLFGITSLYFINNLGSFYLQVFGFLGSSFFLILLTQLMLAFLIMLVPTILMGFTYPVFVKVISTKYDEVGQGAGEVYAVNTWGAVVGALAAGFILIPVFGLKFATLTAAALNLFLAVVVLVVYLLGRARTT